MFSKYTDSDVKPKTKLKDDIWLFLRFYFFIFYSVLFFP